MAGEMGNIRGQIILDVKEAIKAYTAVRQDHLSTVSALSTGAGALTTAGAGMTAVGVGMAAGIVTALKAATEFERKLDYFGAVSGAYGRDLDLAREKALQLGADTIYSADQIADSFVELGKSGVNVQDIIAGIGEATANLGAAADMPLTDAAVGLTTILNTFKLSAEDAVGVVDALSGAANASSIDVQDLILTMSYAGASASVAGIAFEDVNSAIAYLGKVGIRGSKAGTGLRQMFDKLIAPTDKGTEALRGLGLITEEGANQLLNMDGSLRPIPELLDTLNGALDGMTAAERMDVLGNIFPITSLPTILNLLEGGGDALRELNGEIEKTSAADVAAARLDNLSGDVEILSGNLDTLKIRLGATQDEMARGFVQAIIGIVNWIESWSDETLGMVATITAIVAGVLIFVGVLGMFAGAVLNIIGMAMRLRDALGFLRGMLSEAVTWVRLLWAVFIPAPLRLIIGALAVLTAALVAFFTTSETGKNAWASVVDIFTSTFERLQPLIDNLGEAWGRMIEALSPVVDQISTLLTDVLLVALEALVPVVEFLATVIAETLVFALELILPALTWLVDALQGPLGVALGIIAGLIIAVAVAIGIWSAAQTVLNFLLTANPIGLIIMAIAALVAAIVWVATQTTFFQDVWAAVSTWFVEVWNNIASFFTDLWNGIVNVITTAWNAIVAFLTPIFTVIGSIIQVYFDIWRNIIVVFAAVLVTIWNAIMSVIMTVWNAIVAFLSPIISFIVELITSYITNLVTYWTTTWQNISDFFTTIWNAIVSFVTGAVNNLVGSVKGPVTEVKGFWDSTWSAISSFLTTVWNNIVNAVKTAVQNVLTPIRSIKDQVFGFFGGVGDWLYSTGKNLIQGFINGITNMAKTVINAVGDVVNGAIEWAESVLGIRSPSRVFRGIGTNTIEGMIVGMQAMARPLQNQMNMVANSIDDFYDQVYAAREFETVMSLQAEMGIDSYFGTMENQLAMLNEELAVIADKDTIHIEKMETNNPTPEPASDSLPKNIRKAAHLVGA